MEHRPRETSKSEPALGPRRLASSDDQRSTSPTRARPEDPPVIARPQQDDPPGSFLFSFSSGSGDAGMASNRTKPRRPSPTKKPVAIRQTRPQLATNTAATKSSPSRMRAKSRLVPADRATGATSASPRQLDFATLLPAKLPRRYLSIVPTAVMIMCVMLASGMALHMAMLQLQTHGRKLAMEERFPGCPGCTRQETIDDRPVSDWAVSAKALTLAILNLPHNPLMNRRRTAKVAFLFLVQRDLPQQRLWARFFKGSEKFYSTYIHSWEPTNAFKKGNTMRCFVDRDIPHRPSTVRRRPSMDDAMRVVDAQRRLLAWALTDPDNAFFVFLSEYCVPIHNFTRVYDYIVRSKQSFLDSRDTETGGLLSGYAESMKPLVPPNHFATGTPWGAVLMRTHAVALLADTMFYKVFKSYCQLSNEDAPRTVSRKGRPRAARTAAGESCVPEHHYIQTFLHVVDSEGVNSRSLTYQNTSDLKPGWPWEREDVKAAEAEARRTAVSSGSFAAIRSEKAFVRSPFEPQVPCLVNGLALPGVGCYLFARPFGSKQAEKLLDLSATALLASA